MMTTEQRNGLNTELENNLATGQKYAHLIFKLQTIKDYKPSKKAQIIEQAINALKGERPCN